MKYHTFAKPPALSAMFMKILLLYSILYCCVSCTMTVPVKELNSFRTLVTDTSISHRKYNELDFSKRKSDLLNLPYIFKGVDSFELRIWGSYFWTRRELIILRYSQNGWVANEYIYYDNDKTLDSAQILNLQISNDVANKIQLFLKRDTILSLPSQIAIPNFRDQIADGQTCRVEISTKDFYKALDYHCPEHYNEPNNKRFMEIINFLNQYFKFYFPNCKPYQ